MNDFSGNKLVSVGLNFVSYSGLYLWVIFSRLMLLPIDKKKNFLTS